jgi:hydrogenase maturation protease
MNEKNQLSDRRFKVVILGVGNILLKDEGVGVRVVEALRREYRFPREVKLIDGATSGPDLLPFIRATEHLIIVDALRTRRQPGTVFKLTAAELSPQTPATTSLHQIGLWQVLRIAYLLDGRLPSTTIVGVEPQDASHWGLELTDLISSRIPLLIELVLAEIKALDLTVENQKRA